MHLHKCPKLVSRSQLKRRAAEMFLKSHLTIHQSCGHCVGLARFCKGGNMEKEHEKISQGHTEGSGERD